MLAYSLRLGLPFTALVVAAWAVRTSGWLRRHTRRIQIAGGVQLVIVGTLLVTGLRGVHRLVASSHRRFHHPL